MIRAHADNALLAAASAVPATFAMVCAAFATGMAIGAVLYLCVAFRAGVL